MLLLAERQLDDAVVIEIAGIDDSLVIADGRIIELDRAALDMTTGFAVGSGQPGLNDIAGVGIIGGAENPAREGLVAMTVKDKPSVDVVSALREDGIRVHVRKDDYFSGNILTPLGLDSCVRVSMCHYNSPAEVSQFLASVQKMTAS